MRHPPAFLFAVALTTTAAFAADVPAALDFEDPAAWQSAPELLELFPEEHLWLSRHTTFEALASGITLSDERVRSGETSGRWADHPHFPTIHTRAVPPDWSDYAGLSVQVYSEAATGERMSIGVLSNDEATMHDDWLIADFVVDWEGWGEVAMPLADFRALGSPVGWESVQGLYFFTKAFDRQPNPYTVLHLDDIRLLADAPADSSAAPQDPDDHAMPVSCRTPKLDEAKMNHDWPELREPEQAFAPIHYQPYFKKERALFGWYPRFQPGVVSFSPDGRPWIRYGGHILQTPGEDGQWRWSSILDDVLIPYAHEELGFTELGLNAMGSTNDASIRWDADGDAYM
ncbi:MAG: hypothetical protein GF393_03935, partial [Armatimonadia bacterium]|nr:hypothetical protein [Armatimonadia bacterium]